MATITTCYPNIKKAFRPSIYSQEVDMNRVAAIVLGGGQGTRLFPLTQTRCKPAITFGGRYRLIDVPVSNSLNSGCQKIFIITQFLSTSLHQHITRTYRLDAFSSGFIEILAAEQKPHACDWYKGTADAVRQNLEYFIETPADYFLILSGDQLYTMNYQHMVRVAQSTEADVVIAALPIDDKNAKRMGILKVDQDDLVTDFYEKPQEAVILERFNAPRSVLERANIPANSSRKYLGSMGIYLFKREVLIDLLTRDIRDDFGKHLIPAKVKEGNVAVYLHNDYWEDIGTIDSFYEANLALTKMKPDFNCYDERYPLYTNHYNLPGPKIIGTQVKESIICEGTVIEADEISNSIIGPRSVIGKGSIIRNSYIMGNDYYIPPVKTARLPEQLEIGENCIIQKTIIDKNVCIGSGVKLINAQKMTHFDGENIYIRDGVIVVARGAHLPSGFVL